MGTLKLDLHLSSPETLSFSAPQDWNRGNSSNNHNSGLAQVDLVAWPNQTLCSFSLIWTWSSVPRTGLPSYFTVTGFNGIAVKPQVLRVMGFIDSVIPTMLKAWKFTSCKTYHPTWKAYFAWWGNFHPRKLGWILNFLQSGLEQQLLISIVLRFARLSAGLLFIHSICFTRWMFWSLLVPALGVGSPQFGIVGIASVLFALLPTPQLECFCMSQKSIDWKRNRIFVLIV